ncbi:MAG: hypothetical protein QOG50_4002, partial [Actinomycetota bacterium]|nr:hypothetical protein [Actinomycetota bacterium]
SADLDGDLEGAALDLGFSASEAIAALGATPGVDARRVALSRARDLIAARPHVELPVEDRLVARAMAGDELATVRGRRGRHERRWRVLVAAGSVAAAIAVIVGISAMPTTSSSKSVSAAKRPTTPSRENPQSANGNLNAPSSAVASPPDFGDVTKADALFAPARQLLSRSATADAAANQTEPSTKAASPATLLPTDIPQASATRFSFKAVLPACDDGAPGRYAISARRALVATGTVAGAPVVILIYDGAGRPYADVIRVRDCTLVRSQPLG